MPHIFSFRTKSYKNLTNADLLAQLQAIRELALRDYPYPDDTPPLDDNLLLVLGQIAGLAYKAIGDYEEEHPDER